MRFLDYLILALVALGIFLSVKKLRRDGMGCSGDCAHCRKDCKR